MKAIKFSFINIILLFITISLNNYLLNAKIVKGKVYGVVETGEKIPLPSATIVVKESKKATMTNAQGYFEIEVLVPQSIIVSYIGYRKDTILLDEMKQFVEVTLYPELTSEELVVEANKPSLVIEKSSITKSEIITSSGLKKAACCNLSESFVTNPTVDVTYTDAVTGVKQIQLLGLAQNYTQILLEAVPNFQGLAANYGLLFIPGAWMESISISTGTASVTRGYESITGQINVQLKGVENPENILFNAYFNELSRAEFNLVTKHEFGKNFFVNNFLHGNFFNRKIDHNSDGFLDVPTNIQFNILEKIGFKTDAYENESFLQFVYNNSKSGQLGYFDTSLPNSFWGAEVNTRRINFATKNGFIFEGDKSLGTIFSFIHHKQNSFFGNRDFDAEQNSVFTSILWSSNENPFPAATNQNHSTKFNFTVGLSYSYNNYHQYVEQKNLSKEESVPGVLTELSIAPVDQILLVVGSRLDFHNLAGKLFTPRLHIKYDLDENTIVRLSFGKGFHFPLPLIENQSILTSSREILFAEDLKIEEAWNFGLSVSNNFLIFGDLFTLNLSYYHTNFINQIIIDRDISAEKIYIYNKTGKSYSNSFQIDISADVFPNLTLLAAYRLNDVWMTTNNILQRKPLISPHKAFLNIAFTKNPLFLDFTIEFNGGGRLPSTKGYPAEYRLSDRYRSFVVLYGQFTYKFGALELYLGAENVGNFKQINPIIAADKPFSNYFDGSMIWGPIDGRKVYVGMRYTK